ncbi:MAG: diguanylate cyclase [Pseudomonadota bacterium]|nr:diguanylate cyclase [Pseudomonadota bacterium]
MYRYFIGFLFLALQVWSAHGSPLLLDDTGNGISLNPALSYLEDPDSQLQLDDLLSHSQQWTPNGEKTFNKSYNESSWWLKLEIDNPTERTQSRLLEISYPVLDYVDVYLLSGDDLIAQHQLGDKYPYHKRLFDHRNFIIPLTWEPQQHLTVYLRVKTSSAVQVPVTLWDEQSFFGFDTTRTILQGIFFGTMIVIAAYNLLIFFVLGERTYLLYVGYVLCMPLFLASLGGYSFRYLWPTFTQWNDQSIIVFLSGVVIFGASFTRSFLKVRNYSPGIDRALVVFWGGSILLAVSAFFLPYHYNIVALIIWAAGACITALLSGCVCWYKGQITAKYYTIAWTSMLSGGLILAMNKAGILPSNLFTEYGTHIGSALEVVLLSFALAERINAERRMRYEAQEHALIATQRANEELEGRVQERTRELEDLTRQLRDLSNTDQLTGLHNRRHLDSVMLEEWERGKRYKRPLAVILMDIDHFKNVNDTHGHPVGDDCLQEVAKRVQAGVRWPTDFASRYGGEEFCIILPETEVEGALTVAERIRSLIESDPILTRNGPLPITISAGVHSLVPDANNTPQSLLEQADMALYQAKQQGRNRVCPRQAA